MSEYKFMSNILSLDSINRSFAPRLLLVTGMDLVYINSFLYLYSLFYDWDCMQCCFDLDWHSECRLRSVGQGEKGLKH